MTIQLFGIVKADGTLKYRRSGHGSGPMVFDDEGKARKWARADGDSVVVIDVDLKREPVFIRRKVVTAGTDE
jgi:hypothetical protein